MGALTGLVVVVPSRSRPAAARDLAQAFAHTCTAGTELVFAVDDDDPELGGYGGLPLVAGKSTSMVEALNRAALKVLDREPFAVGFMGDDHRPRTAGWDQAYLDALRDLGTGIVYGNDLMQGARLPTQCAMTADIVRTLGYMAPPSLTHLYVDNFWLDLGRHAGCLRYLPDAVVEHLHPLAGKADWDAGYDRVNAPAMYDADQAAYVSYLDGRFETDLAAVRGLR